MYITVMKPSRSKLLVSSLKRTKTAQNIVNQGKLILFNDNEAIQLRILYAFSVWSLQ